MCVLNLILKVQLKSILVLSLRLSIFLIVKHSQSSQNSKFAMSLQYLKKEVRYEVDFLDANKRQSFYNLALLFLMEVARHELKISW